MVPDNGLISPVIDRDGLDSAREITNTSWMIGEAVSSTFHGRDIFSPAGAHLAAGWDYTLVGPVVSQLVRLTLKCPPSLTRASTAGHRARRSFRLAHHRHSGCGHSRSLAMPSATKSPSQSDKRPFTLPYVKTFMDVPVGDRCSTQDSRGRIGLAVNQRNFSQVNKITPPVSMFIPKKGAPLKGK